MHKRDKGTLVTQLEAAGWELIADIRIQGQRYQLTFECAP